MKKSILISGFILLFLFLFIILANIRTPYCCIENDYKKFDDDYKYTTEIFEKQNDLNYICISYDINNDLFVDYGSLYNISTTTFDDFFDNILVADKFRIEKLINKCRLKQIIFKKGNSNYNDYVQYVRWMSKSYARGLVYTKQEYNPIDSDVIECIPLEDNYFLFEEK